MKKGVKKRNTKLYETDLEKLGDAVLRHLVLGKKSTSAQLGETSKNLRDSPSAIKVHADIRPQGFHYPSEVMKAVKIHATLVERVFSSLQRMGFIETETQANGASTDESRVPIEIRIKGANATVEQEIPIRATKKAYVRFGDKALPPPMSASIGLRDGRLKTVILAIESGELLTPSEVVKKYKITLAKCRDKVNGYKIDAASKQRILGLLAIPQNPAKRDMD